MAGQRRAHDVDRQAGAGPFAEPHAEIEQRREPKCGKQPAMAGLGRDMPGQRMGQSRRVQLLQRRRRGRADKTVEQHGNFFVTRGERRAHDRGKLASAKCGRYP
jgi:hypothetical protein